MSDDDELLKRFNALRAPVTYEPSDPGPGLGSSSGFSGPGSGYRSIVDGRSQSAMDDDEELSRIADGGLVDDELESDASEGISDRDVSCHFLYGS